MLNLIQFLGANGLVIIGSGNSYWISEEWFAIWHYRLRASF